MDNQKKTNGNVQRVPLKGATLPHNDIVRVTFVDQELAKRQPLFLDKLGCIPNKLRWAHWHVYGVWSWSDSLQQRFQRIFAMAKHSANVICLSLESKAHTCGVFYPFIFVLQMNDPLRFEMISFFTVVWMAMHAVSDSKTFFNLCA